MKEKKDKKNILIFANAVLGDCILCMPFLKEIQKMYPKSAGYQIFLICRPAMKNFYIKYSGCDEIEYIESNLKKIKDIRFVAEFYKLVRILNRRKYEKVIIAHSKRFNYYAAFCTNAREIYAIIYEARFHRLYQMEQNLILNKIRYIVFKSEDYFIGNSYRNLIKILGNENYSSCIHKISVGKLSKCKKAEKGPYVVIAPYGSDYAREIPETMLIMLIHYLIEKTEMPIYVVGTVRDKENHFMDCLGQKEKVRVRDYVGQTNLDQLVELIWGCTFVIAMDSGVTHLAAALQIKNICIVGNWGKGQFLPYDYDEKAGKSFFPRCIFPVEQFNCRNCDFIARRGKVNIECRRSIKSGKNYLCLEQIDINDVYREIDTLLKEKEGNRDA